MSGLRDEPAVVVGVVAALFVVVVVVASSGQSAAVSAAVAGVIVLVGGVVTRCLVSPVARVDDARNEGAAQILDAVAESRLDPDLWEAICAVPAADDRSEGGDPGDPHGRAVTP